MVKAYIYIEGGGDSKELHSRCREGFRQLLECCGFTGRLPRLVACGGRSATFRAFVIAHAHSPKGTYVAMLVDSEDPVADIEKPWEHLRNRVEDNWPKPAGADDEQVLMMTTCMETWVVTDRATLRAHYGAGFQESALPALVSMESRDRGVIQDALADVTRECKNPYAKGKRSFDVVGKLVPATLATHLPSFQRFQRVLDKKL